MTNHSIDEFYFNKWCEICGRVKHNTDECYYQERSKPQMKGLSKKSMSSDNDEGLYDTWSPRNMRISGSSQLPNKQFVKSKMNLISRIASHPHSQDNVKRNLIKQFLDEPGPSHVVPSLIVSKQMKSAYESAKQLSKPYVHKSKTHELPIELNDRFEVLMSQYAKLKSATSGNQVSNT